MELILGDSLEELNNIKDNSVNMIITSPPYDDIKNYNNTIVWNFYVFKKIANLLYSKLKEGGVIVWVVADKTKKGSESGSSFKQALYFKEIGLNLHDTMIYKKNNYTPLTHRRYEQEFEFMFCFSKGKPSTFNPIKIPCKYARQETWGKPKYYKNNSDKLTQGKKQVISDTKIKGNIFNYTTGSTKTGKVNHPAMFPLELAIDQIKSWSNEGDLILDPFMGSGTSGIACLKLNRNFIGIEKVKEYYDICVKRTKGVKS